MNQHELEGAVIVTQGELRTLLRMMEGETARQRQWVYRLSSALELPSDPESSICFVHRELTRIKLFYPPVARRVAAYLDTVIRNLTARLEDLGLWCVRTLI